MSYQTNNQKEALEGIDVTEVYVEDVPATGVIILVTIKGSSFVTGQTAVKKANEVASLVEALTKVGLPEDKISVETVKLQASSGAILKTSSASYTLKLNCEDLEKMSDILTVVTSAKNISLDSMEWQFNDLEQHKPNWIKSAIEKANTSAAEAARALGSKIGRVRHCRIEYINIQETIPRRADDGAFTSVRRRVAFNIGMPMQQTEEKGVRVIVTYDIVDPSAH